MTEQKAFRKMMAASRAEMKSAHARIRTPKPPSTWRSEIRHAKAQAQKQAEKLQKERELYHRRYIDGHIEWYAYPPKGEAQRSMRHARHFAIAQAALLVQEATLGAYGGTYMFNLAPLFAVLVGISIAVLLFLVARPAVKLIVDESEAVREQDRKLRKLALTLSAIWAASVATLFILARAAGVEIPALEIILGIAFATLAFVSPALAGTLGRVAELRGWGNVPAERWSILGAELDDLAQLERECDEKERTVDALSNVQDVETGDSTPKNEPTISGASDTLQAGPSRVHPLPPRPVPSSGDYSSSAAGD